MIVFIFFNVVELKKSESCYIHMPMGEGGVMAMSTLMLDPSLPEVGWVEP